MRDEIFDVFHLKIIAKMSDQKVHKILNLGKQNDYLYDIETETHDFNLGCRLIVHNTDSFVLSMNTENIIKDLKGLKDLFDFSNSNENHELFSNKNKKVIGKL